MQKIIKKEGILNFTKWFNKFTIQWLNDQIITQGTPLGVTQWKCRVWINKKYPWDSTIWDQMG